MNHPLERKIKNLRKHVLAVLESTPKARDSDQYLTLCIWNRYYSHLLFKNESDAPCVSLANIMHLPREDNVKRLRAKIQNEEHKFLPTTIEVARKRNIAEEIWYKYNLYN